MVLYLILPGPKCLVALIFWDVEPISCPSPRKQVLAYQNPMAPRHHSIIVQFRLKWLKGMEPNHVSNWRPITFPILWKVRGFEDSQKKIERVTCPRRWRQSWAALPVGISAFWYGGNPQRWWLFFPGKSWKKMFHCQGESPEGQCPETTTTTATTTTTIQQFNTSTIQQFNNSTAQLAKHMCQCFNQIKSHWNHGLRLSQMIPTGRPPDSHQGVSCLKGVRSPVWQWG